MSVCTFFGHRDCPASVRPALRKQLITLIENCRVSVFYVGNQGDFDAMVRGLLKELLPQYPQIRYGVVLAYMPKTGAAEAEDTMLPEGIECVPRRFAIPWRNRWMLDRADYVVTYVTHGWGGAARFAQEAAKRGKTVYNLFQCSALPGKTGRNP